jgi:hypothetical protein
VKFNLKNLILMDSSRVLLQNALIDLALIFVTFSIQCIPTSEGPNAFILVLGPFANVNNVPVQYAACYFMLFLTEFAKLPMFSFSRMQ